MSHHSHDPETRHDSLADAMANADTVFSIDSPNPDGSSQGSLLDQAAPAAAPNPVPARVPDRLAPTGNPTGERLGLANTAESPDAQTVINTASDSLAGQVWAGRYHCMRLLGAGGMGAVYLAHDHELDELVAIKMLRESVAASPDAIDFLRHEVRLARRVTHRNVARIFELGEHNGRRFLTMEYIDGTSLAGLLARDGRMSLAVAAPLLRDICGGLSAVHEAGVVHRDIKPDNILVAHGGRVVLADFGIARTTRGSMESTLQNARAGTPAYMSPEQLVGGQVTPRSDVYSLGVLAFEMLTGKLPWTLLNQASDRLTADPPSPRDLVPDLPDPIVRLLRQTLAIRPDARVPSPAAFADTLTAAVTALTRLDRHPDRITLTGGQPDPRLAEHSSKLSIAVLPFRNRGGGNDDFLASGFTEDLIDCLSEIAGLRVLSRGATARYAQDARESHEIGRELRIHMVVEGSLQRVGQAVQIRARAIESAEGVQRWSRRYRVPPEELLVTSEQAAEALAAALVPSAPKAEDSDNQRPRTALPDAAAMEAYLRARESHRRFTNPIETLDLYQEAVRLAPDSPQVHAGLATALLRMWMFNSWAARSDRDLGQNLPERARAAAQKAKELAPDLGEPHHALGLLALHQGEPVTAVREFRTAIALAPSMVSAHAFLGELLAEMNRLPDALRRLDAVRLLDPNNGHAKHTRQRMAALTGNYELAQQLSSTYEITTALGWLTTGRTAAYRGDIDGLREIYKQVEKMPSDAHGMKEWVMAQFGVYIGEKPAEAVYTHMTTNVPIHQSSRRGQANFFQIVAEVAGFAGDVTIGLDAVERLVNNGFIDQLWLDRCPLLDSLREHRRFVRLRSRVQERVHTVYDALWTA